METTEKIVEAYARYVRHWATIPNVRCDGGFEIDLLAINPKTGERYHIETSISVSPNFSKLTDIELDTSPTKNVHKATLRRTIGYFIKSKFEADPIIKKLAEYGFESNATKRIIATWDSTKEAKTAALKAGIELWSFPTIMRKIAEEFTKAQGYFGDDTLRTIGLYAKSLNISEETHE